jgi:hypothetical protein
MNPNNFGQLEIEITKIAYRQKVNVPITQYTLYSELLNEYDLKDPKLKNDLKMNTLIVMRHLQTLYDDFKLIDENDVLSVILIDKNEPFINNRFNSSNINENFSTKNDSMPLKKDVINWIVDNNIDYSITKEDLIGNTILHYLVQNNDVDRIKIVMHKYPNLSFYTENQDGIRPIDLITSFKVSNIVIFHLNNEINELNENYIIINKKYNNSINELNKWIYFLLIIIVFLFFK